MSWTELFKTASDGHSDRTHAVVAQSIAATCRMKPRITITLRPDMIGPEAAWIVAGATFRLLIGSGEHANMLRIEPCEDGRKFAGSGGKKAKRPMVILQGQDWLPAERHARTGLDFDSGEGWVEITLPLWGRPRAAEIAQVDRPVAQPTAPRRGVSFVDHIADPVAARRRSQAPIGAGGGGGDERVSAG